LTSAPFPVAKRHSAELAETTGPGHRNEIAQKATRDGRELVIAAR